MRTLRTFTTLNSARPARNWIMRAVIALALLLPLAPAASYAGVFISVAIAPPVLPIYPQPICPAPGYLWTPGYWGYGPAGYYWVPGVWVHPPMVGVLWTPGYWGFGGGLYAWHPGYWGAHVGFYGGVNYGFGYGGVGFAGGYWRGGQFAYNRSVTNINTTIIHNTYNQTVVNNTNINRTSYNGGIGGINARPTTQDQLAARDQHIQPTANQIAHQQGRIANGIGSGQLTANEARNLEGREGNLNGTIRNDRQANGGYLTPQERQNVNQRQNNISNSIYNDRHNGAASGYGNNEVGTRRYDQQQRIAQGVRSGQMTPAEAARAENRQGNINRQISADRQANGGRLTPQQRRNINRRQNGASRQIYNEKHNGTRAPR